MERKQRRQFLRSMKTGLISLLSSASGVGRRSLLVARCCCCQRSLTKCQRCRCRRDGEMQDARRQSSSDARCFSMLGRILASRLAVVGSQNTNKKWYLFTQFAIGVYPCTRARARASNEPHVARIFKQGDEQKMKRQVANFELCRFENMRAIVFSSFFCSF